MTNPYFTQAHARAHIDEMLTAAERSRWAARLSEPHVRHGRLSRSRVSN